MKTALISVYNKDGIVDFAQELSQLGFDIVSSGGTAKVLSESGVSVTDVSDITGIPAILGHRVVTLHPKIHGGLLAKDDKDHNFDRARYGIPWIDLVCVDFYPLQKAIDDGLPKDEVIEMIDIGGPTMALSAAKSRRIIVCDFQDRRLVIDELKSEGRFSEEFIDYLVWRAFDINMEYRKIAAEYLKSFIPF